MRAAGVGDSSATCISLLMQSQPMIHLRSAPPRCPQLSRLAGLAQAPCNCQARRHKYAQCQPEIRFRGCHEKKASEKEPGWGMLWAIPKYNARLLRLSNPWSVAQSDPC